ncbi:hypothetical protein D3C87_1632440 [compost metagenome]
MGADFVLDPTKRNVVRDVMEPKQGAGPVVVPGRLGAHVPNAQCRFQPAHLASLPRHAQVLAGRCGGAHEFARSFTRLRQSLANRPPFFPNGVV